MDKHGNLFGPHEIEQADPAAPAGYVISDAQHQQFLKAVENCIRHAMRSLLDFTDLQCALNQDKANPVFWEAFKKRIVNDQRMLGHQLAAAIEIMRNGGTIPPFGRTEEQIRANAARPPRQELIGR